MTLPSETLRIATRASALATWQAEHVASLLKGLPGERSVELVLVTTQGDRDQNSALSAMGGMGVFTREVQSALLDQRADLAVHSLKDLQTEQTAGLILGAVLPRAPRCDALLMPHGKACQSLDELPQGARIGTGSPRRRAQLLKLRPDLVTGEARGNLDTRLRKLDEGQFDALILAEAGLRRLGWEDRISLILAPPVMFPAVGQGAIGIECRADDARTLSLLAQLDDPVTRIEVTAERACLASLRAGCHAPVGVWSEVITTENGEQQLRFQASVWKLDGRERVGVTLSGLARDAAEIGNEAARQILKAGGDRLIGSSN